MAGRFSIETVFQAVDRMTAPVNRMQRKMARFTGSVEHSMKRIDKATTKFNKGLKSGAQRLGVALTATAGVVGLLVREFSKVENAEAAFTPLLGGAAKAQEMVQKLNDTAASTPFQFETLAGAAGQLLPVMNGDIERTIETMRRLGDTAGGNAQKLDSITRGYTKAMLKGKVDMEALNMIAEAGVPIFSELAESMGIEPGEKFFKMISAGKVTTEDLDKAFKRMTSEGGIFFGGMEIASRTTSGLLSTLKDNVGLAAASIGGALAPAIKELIGDLTVAAKKVRAWADANKGLISEKALAFVTALRDNFDQIVTWLKRIGVAMGVWITFMAILKTFIVVMTAVNLVMALNPVGLIVLGVMALVAAFTALVVWIDDVAAGFDKLPGIMRLMLAPLGLIIKGIKFIKDNWGAISDFISKGAQFLGFGGGDDQQAPQAAPGGNGAPQMVSPAQRIAETIRTTEAVQRGEVVIRDETGRAEQRGKPVPGVWMLDATGAF